MPVVLCAVFPMCGHTLFLTQKNHCVTTRLQTVLAQGGWSGRLAVSSRDGCAQRCGHLCDTRNARRYAVLAVCRFGVLVVLCAVVPVCVCMWSHTVFSVRGSLRVTTRLQTVQRVPSLRVWLTVTPCAYHLLGSNTMGSRVLLSPVVCNLFSTALKSAVLPHFHDEGPPVSRFNGTRLSSLALAGTAAVYQSQVQVCVVLPRVSGIITVLLAPPES